MPTTGQVQQLEQKADTRLIKKLQAHNKRYRLGLAIHNYPTILSPPDWLESEEIEAWSEIRDRISTIHREPDGSDRIHAILGVYRDWARSQDDRWVRKPRGDRRVLGIPHSHIGQLKLLLGLSQHSSTKHNKRKSAAISGRNMPDPEIQYPRIPEISSAPVERPTIFSDSRDQDDSSRKRPRTAFTSDPVNSAMNLGTESLHRRGIDFDPLKSEPTIDVSFESASGSRNTSFRRSFASAPEYVDTPATSFGSVHPPSRPNAQGGMAPPPVRPVHSIEVPKRSQRTRNDESPSGSLGEFHTTSSWEEALWDAVGQPAQLPRSRSQHGPSDSQASQSTEYYMIQAEASYSHARRNPQPLLITPPTDGPESTRTTSSAPGASGETAVVAQSSSLEAPISGRLRSSKPESSHRSTQSTGPSVVRLGEPQHPLSTAASRTSSATRASSHTSKHLQKELFRPGKSPFNKVYVEAPESLDYHALWEVTRVALARDKKPEDIYSDILDAGTHGYEKFWSSILEATKSSRKSVMRSSTHAWQKASKAGATDVTFSGKLIVEKDGGRLKTDLMLQPLRLDKSCRLSRKFGSDRFFFLDIPRIPEAEDFHERLPQWLAARSHRFLGRNWRCVYLKNLSGKGSAFAYQATFFATKGIGFEKYPSDQAPSIQDMQLGSRYAVNSHQLVDWLLNLSANRDANALKYFSRIGLGLTKTTSSIVFLYDQIAWTRDACSCHPGPRNLRNDQLSHNSTQHSGKVMNDGVGRISYEAAQQIRRMLDLPDLPAAFQARIGGAKGVWHVDRSGEKYKGHEIWIEITESQHKFDCLTGRENGEDAHRTFEVHSHSHALSEHHLSYTLIPILAHGNIPRETFENLLCAHFTRMNENAHNAMVHGGAIMLEWVQTIMSVAAERATHGKVRMTGGFPDSTAERLIMLAESGHHPSRDRIMADLCIDAIENFYKHQDERLEIGLPKSTHVLMIADPVGILEPGEVFLQFSRPFEDKETGELTQSLDNTEILVARFPAYLPWEVQKVRAVFRRELSQYKDVVIFSVKGERSLADVLSGGDFDGDKAWICWEESLVRPFINTPFQEPPDITTYGIDKKSESVREVRKRGHRALWKEGVAFNMRPSMLGICANYFLSWAYCRESMSSRRSLLLGSLLGYLVDTSKNGYTFSNHTWRQFLRDESMDLSLEKPAWKSPGATRGSPDSIPDYLRFYVAVEFKQRIQAKYKALRDHIGSHDSSLTEIVRSEEEKATSRGEGEALRTIVRHLAREFSALYDKYQLASPHRPESVAGVQDEAERRKHEMPDGKYLSGVQDIRRRFLAIEPPEGCKYYLAEEWREEARATSSTDEEWEQNHHAISATFGSWTRFKASLLAREYQRRVRFIYVAAGKELCEIKALTSTHPTEVYAIIGNIRAALRVDKSFVKRLTSRVPVTAVDDEDNDDIDSQFGLGVFDD